MTKDRELLKRVTVAIRGVYKGVGTPGDFGYESREGRALNDLYNLNNEIVAFLDNYPDYDPAAQPFDGPLRHEG